MPRHGSVLTLLKAATLRQKLKIKFAKVSLPDTRPVSPDPRTSTACQVVATGMTISSEFSGAAQLLVQPPGPENARRTPYVTSSSSLVLVFVVCFVVAFFNVELCGLLC